MKSYKMNSLDYLCFIIILIITSCNRTYNKSEDGLYAIDPRTFVDNKILLSELADDIQYIPLDNSIPFVHFKYVITSRAIYVAAKGIGILKFDSKGKLIEKIGARGKGPGEFRYGMAFTVDDLTGNIYILDPTTIFVYSPGGRFIRDIPLNEYGSYGFNDIEIFNSLLFIPDHLPTGESKNCWIFLDTLGRPVAMRKNYIPPFQSGIETPGNIYKYGNNIFYYNYFNDTIFSVSPDLSDTCVYLFAQGDFRWPKERIVVTRESLATQFNNIFRPSQMFETKKYLIFHYAYRDQCAIALIDKEYRKTFLLYRKEKNMDGKTVPIACITNDIDGGLPLDNINYYHENGYEYFTSLIDPFQLKSHIVSESFKKANPKYPEKKKELEKLASGLKETDNPVLVMVRLKH
jgi:hypothetical protein